MMLNNLKEIRWFGLWVMVAVGNVHAGTDQEREILTRLLREIKSLEPMVKEAQQSSAINDRQKFDYPLFEKDLSMIAQGISDYLNIKRRDPRSLPSVEGEYRQ